MSHVLDTGAGDNSGLTGSVAIEHHVSTGCRYTPGIRSDGSIGGSRILGFTPEYELAPKHVRFDRLLLRDGPVVGSGRLTRIPEEHEQQRREREIVDDTVAGDQRKQFFF